MIILWDVYEMIALLLGALTVITATGSYTYYTNDRKLMALTWAFISLLSLVAGFVGHVQVLNGLPFLISSFSVAALELALHFFARRRFWRFLDHYFHPLPNHQATHHPAPSPAHS